MTFRQFDALWQRHVAQEERLDYRTAQLCSVVANAAGGKKDGKPFTAEDFMPKKQATSRKQTTDQMLRVVKMLNAAFGGKVIEN